MVYTVEGKGDNGFNDQAYSGVKKARNDMGLEVKEATPSGPDQYRTLFKKFAQKDFDLIMSLSADSATPMKQAAKNFPKQQFQIMDYEVDVDNIASYTFADNEAAYLAGVLAAKLTTRTEFSAADGSINSKKNVGFLGGKKQPVIARFQAGYQAGIESVDKKTEVPVNYAGTWSSPQKGQRIAGSMYSNGADIVFPAAGNTGTGAFKAAQQQSAYAIGVDKAQSKALPKYADVILGSVVKRVDTAVVEGIKAVKNGNFSGKSHQLGLKKDGVTFAYGKQLGSEIPDDLKSTLKDTKEKIANGDIDVPDTVDQQ